MPTQLESPAPAQADSPDEDVVSCQEAVALDRLFASLDEGNAGLDLSLMGATGLEPVTPSVSSWCSSQLS